MDEAREEREELAALEREAADELREQEAAQGWWSDVQMTNDPTSFKTWTR